MMMMMQEEGYSKNRGLWTINNSYFYHRMYAPPAKDFCLFGSLISESILLQITL